jgi:hypothetical protein
MVICYNVAENTTYQIYLLLADSCFGVVVDIDKVERFGKNETNWEEYKLHFTLEGRKEPDIDLWEERPVGKCLKVYRGWR